MPILTRIQEGYNPLIADLMGNVTKDAANWFVQLAREGVHPTRIESETIIRLEQGLKAPSII